MKVSCPFSSKWVITVNNANAAVTLLEQRPEKNFFQALSGIRTHDLCGAGAVLSQLSYQSQLWSLSWESTAPAPQRSWVRIPLRAWKKFFQVSVPVVLRPHLHYLPLSVIIMFTTVQWPKLQYITLTYITLHNISKLQYNTLYLHLH